MKKNVHDLIHHILAMQLCVFKDNEDIGNTYTNNFLVLNFSFRLCISNHLGFDFLINILLIQKTNSSNFKI